MPLKNILFDFDGTLVDSAPGIVKTMEQTFVRMGLPVPEDNAMRATIGLPLRDALQQLGGLSDEDAQRATETYRELFPVYEVNWIRVFDGVSPTLEALRERGIRMAIATSRDCMSLELVAEKRGLMPFFETAVTGADGLKPKPAPDIVLALLDRMQIRAEETLVVGDTTYDIGMGNAAGCRTVAVTYGNHDEATLRAAGPSWVIGKFAQLMEIV